ncbi:HAD-IIIA family hydrolase [Planococcus sp. S3-L1]|uniref:D-glycero-alpha-D-manno-heptose-1,7-bisphosphate 7-phosphatase n=1 Tax=Planococcus sp. S3-L1 TaxID=3046200 RepID=UPI0024BA4F07|nr:HAD-IIIA family hydrolase [Planococcus sp. S3-L1]MDJ0332867.1 HAD-IIIA family hydrolase [Planococcus sp. S3-L1]
MKVAFFDRDGTIIEDYPDAKWTFIDNPSFLEGAVETLKTVISKGYRVIIITNQYLINEEFITLNQYNDITNKMLHILHNHGIEILDIFYCPHSKKEECRCFKPKTGMIDQALKKYAAINMAESFMIGDSLVDVELAANAKIKGFGIGVEKTSEDEKIYQLTSIKDLPQHI